MAKEGETRDRPTPRGHIEHPAPPKTKRVPIEDLPQKAPGRVTTSLNEDVRMTSLAKVVAREMPCELEVRTGSESLGDRNLEGRLIVEARPPGAVGTVTIGAIPEGQNPREFLAKLEELAHLLISTKQVAPRRKSLGKSLDHVDDLAQKLDRKHEVDE